jgi:hypothetical protein
MTYIYFFLQTETNDIDEGTTETPEKETTEAPKEEEDDYYE